jgi:RHS repeat-associated protein
VSYYHYDGLGSTRVLTDDAGGVTDTYTYEAFGDLLRRTGATENSYLFTGEQYDPNAGFYYLRARYYNSENGRFLTRDTWQGNMFEQITLHSYFYCNVNPVMYTDPSGKFSLNELATATDVILTLHGITSGFYNAINGDYEAAATNILETAFFGFVGMRKGLTGVRWWKKSRDIRKSYNLGVKEIRQTVSDMKKSQKSMKEIAEKVTEIRNKAKVEARKFMDPKEVKKLEARNMGIYKDPVGPSAEYLFKKYGSWEAIIEASERTNRWLNLLFLSF